jgi:putative lipoprotein
MGAELPARLRPLAAALALGLAGCVSPAGPAQLTGSVTYRERGALPPGAVVNVMLLDVSLVGVPPRVVAKQEIRPEGQVPIPFALQYDRAAIDPTHRYGLRANIMDASGRLLWINVVIVPVLREGAPEQPTIVLQRAHAMREP